MEVSTETSGQVQMHRGKANSWASTKMLRWKLKHQDTNVEVPQNALDNLGNWPDWLESRESFAKDTRECMEELEQCRGTVTGRSFADSQSRRNPLECSEGSTDAQQGMMCNSRVMSHSLPATAVCSRSKTSLRTKEEPLVLGKVLRFRTENPHR